MAHVGLGLGVQWPRRRNVCAVGAGSAPGGALGGARFGVLRVWARGACQVRGS